MDKIFRYHDSSNDRGTTVDSVLYDNCIVCGGRSHEFHATPIDERSCYVDGAGQLCFDCYGRIYSSGGYEGKKAGFVPYQR